VAAGRGSGEVLSAKSESAGATNIRVAVRIRPMNERELSSNAGASNIIEVIDERMLVFDPKGNEDEFYYKGKRQNRRDLNKREKKDHKFAFDMVFGPEADNAEVFEKSTKDLVDVLFGGYNCSVFSYGATGAGKTFTMLGGQDNPGLTWRTVTELYQRVEAVKEDVACDIVCSYLEVYNETIVDLLNPGQALNVREDGNAAVAVPGLSVHKPEGPEHLLQLLRVGNANRTQHPTDANAESSRSHAVFQVSLRQKSRATAATADVRLAKLSMIDLAGSERGTVAMAGGAKRLREGANINKSLLALGNCITALADGSKYVPYRDSKLTRLLKDSIGGNCRTVMISNVSPCGLAFEDTYNTLKYADRAKRIKIKLKRNVAGGGVSELQMAQYAKNVESLKATVAALERENAALKQQLEAKPAEEKANTCEGCSQTDPIAIIEGSDERQPALEHLTRLFQKHRLALRRANEATSQAKILKLRRDFTKKIKERSALVSLKGDPAGGK